MPELTREEKIKIFEKLPKELQNLMQSEDTSAFLLYLGKKYNLATDKIHLLSKLVGDIVLGITSVTSLAQEINSKILSDPQASMHMAQELYAELLSPVMAEAKPLPTPQMPIPSPSPVPTPPTSIIRPSIPDTKYKIPTTDRYREPTNGAPEIVDLRNQHKAGPPLAETPPSPRQSFSEGGLPSGLPVSPAPAYIPPPAKPAAPLTFTKPVEPPAIKKIEPPAVPTPLIEANPHLPAKISPEISAGKVQEENMVAPPVVSPSTPFRASRVEPQFIIRPPGLAPTDAPHNILDLRRDKGEF